MRLRLPLLVLATCYSTLAFAAPDWCKPLANTQSQYFDFERIEKDNEPREVTQAIVGIICAPRDESQVPKAEEARKRWSQTLMMNDQDWAAAAEYWATFDKYAAAEQPSRQGYAGLDPLDQYLLLANYGRVSPDGHYVADAASPLSESGRLGYAIWCSRENWDKDAHLAACIQDIEALDLKKIVDEVRADTTHNAKIGYLVRLGWIERQSAFAKLKGRRDTLIKQDPAYAQMFKIAAKAFSDWNANSDKRQKLLGLAGEMDNARETQSRKATAGCEDKVTTELRSAVGMIPADRFTRVLGLENKFGSDEVVASGIMTYPESYLAAMAYATCFRETKTNNYLAEILGAAMSRWPGYRGPRSAAIADIMQAGLELDKRDSEISYPDLHRDMLGDDRSLKDRGQNNGSGLIASIKAGKEAVISFKNKNVTSKVCVDYKAGHRITGIMANGQFEYAGTCYKYKDVTGSVAIQPVKADGRWANGLKPGQFTVVIAGVPYASWMPNAKEPATILGVPVH